MKIRKRMIGFLCCFLCMGFLTACGGKNEPVSGNEGNAGKETKEVTLKLFAAWPENNSNLVDMDKFISKVDEKSNHTIKIQWGGGPEAIPANQLAEAIKNGVVDIAWTAHTYNVSHIPVMEGMKLTDADLMRTNGGFEFIDSLYVQNLNAHYLGVVTNGLTYNLYTKNEIKSLDDFKGLTIRATPAYQAFVEGLGAGAVNTSAGEAYQALERNVIQGYGWPSFGIMDYGWQEVSEYIIEPAFYTVDVAVFASDKVWKTLSEEQQNALVEAGKEVEEEAREYYAKAIQEDQSKLMEAGMKVITLPDDMAKTYLELANDEAWKNVLKADPENGEKLKGYTE
ncbi:TRAP transporter substrate-binding protein DctP [Lachnospiraceae bacterium 62-35]